MRMSRGQFRQQMVESNPSQTYTSVRMTVTWRAYRRSHNTHRPDIRSRTHCALVGRPNESPRGTRDMKAIRSIGVLATRLVLEMQRGKS